MLLETSTEYGRGLLRGILRYSRLHGPWSLSVAAGHLDQAMPKGSAWGGTGIIARIKSPEMERLLRATGIPYVASTLFEARSPRVGSRCGEICTDSVAIARMGATHLLEAGLRRFAFCGFANCQWSTVREKEFSQCVRDRGCSCETHHIALANWMQRPSWISSWEQEQPILARWVKGLPKPVGVMACNDACGMELLQVCTAEGLRVPDEVAVVGVDNDEMMCELSNPPLSSIALDVDKAGYEAARLLDGLMSGRSAEGQVVWVEPTDVVPRRSSDVIAQEDPLVAQALHLIHEQARRALSVNDVTSEVGVSRRTLERHFTRSLGRSILSEIMRCHVERAKRLLLETDLPCHQVATEAGFGSLKTFNRSFSRKAGTTPQDFRRRSSTALGKRSGGTPRALPQ